MDGRVSALLNLQRSLFGGLDDATLPRCREVAAAIALQPQLLSQSTPELARNVEEWLAHVKRLLGKSDVGAPAATPPAATLVVVLVNKCGRQWVHHHPAGMARQ